jgi:molybdopterin-guanine dinucleotide biosynthesis protein A
VTDPTPGEGPLRGILTALESVQGSILVVPVDMPNIARQQLEWLTGQIQKLEHCITLATRPSGGDVEPFPCILRRAAIQPIRDLLAAGRRSVKTLFNLPDARILPAPADWPIDTWLNLNRPEDLRSLGA